MSELIGKVLGLNYRIVEPIGSGAMGMVFVVEHVALKKRFAAKLLTADLARHPEAIARFEVEAHAASQLDHENIVSVIDYGKTDDGCVFIIMELLRGKTLQARMDQGTPSADEVVSIMIQVCRALAAAHAADIVHRDMKPENIFLTQRPGGRLVVKVLDFGISKARENSIREGRITKQGQLLGSPEYMSPEASRGDEVDPRADIYAVGIMLYELLCGEVPFRHENYLKVLQMHASQAPRPPRQLAPELPEAVERLILRALEKDPRKRQSSIEELETELMSAMPEVAERVLHQAQSPSVPWLNSSTNPRIVLTAPNPSLSEVTEVSQPARPGQGDVSTLDTRRRGRGFAVALWSILTVAAAGAAAFAVLRFSRNAGEGGREAVASPVEGAEGAGGKASQSTPEPAIEPTVQPVEAQGAAADAQPASNPAAEPTEADTAGEAEGDAVDREASGAADASGDRDQAADSPSEAEHAAHPGEIRLRIVSTPSGAMATLDGKRLGRTPIDAWVAASEREIAVELDLRGYRPATRSFALDRDRVVRATLRRDTKRTGAAARKTGGKSTRTSGDERPDRPSTELDIKEGR